MGKIIGIDLGTTNSCVAVFEGSEPVVIANSEGKRTTPSVIGFVKDGDRKVGDPAKRQAITNPKNTVYSIKRFMGETYEQSRKEAESMPYTVVNENGYPRVDIEGRKYTPQEISAMVLQKMKKTAEDYLGQEVTDAVITVPAYFSDSQRQATKEAGQIAGLNVRRIVNEPTAAAISYGVKSTEPKTVLVYDLGGGTFDVTIINVNGGAIKVIATGGDHHLGGVDWDTLLSEYVLGVFNEQNGTSYSLEDNKELKYSLLLEAERWKKMLSAKQSVKINFNFGGMSCRTEVSRELFDSLTEGKLQETIDATAKVIEIAHQKGLNNIDEFLLVGGSSRMSQVKERIDREFNCDAKLADPDQCVAKGAAIYAMNEAYAQAVRDWEEGEIDVKPETLRGDRTRVVNVTSKTYGTDITDNRVSNIIFANTSLPAKRQMNFLTQVDGQSGVSMKVFESDFTDEQADAVVEDRFCTLLRDETLKLSKSYPAGTTVSVTYDIDNEGILHVNAFVDRDVIDFELKIEGVKSAEELQKSIAAIDKTVVE